MTKTWLLVGVLLLVVRSGGQTSLALAQPCNPTLAQPPLCASDVQAVIDKTRGALDVPFVIAVVDRVGNVLGVHRKTGAPETVFGNFANESTFSAATKQDAVEVAIALARTGAFFSNNQAPLSSRTVRFISGIHFPPGISFTANAALYGIENTNRGCDLNVAFRPGKEVPRAKALSDLPCNSSDRRGCSLGILTGKADLFDSDPTAVNPGGIPLFKGDTVVGGLGVVGDVPANLLEFAAFFGALTPAGTTVLPVPAFFVNSLSERVFIDGVRLPFVNLKVRKILKGKLPKKARPDPNPTGEMVVAPRDGACFDRDENGGICRAAPEGYLLGPLAGAHLSVDEVDRMVNQSLETANRTRAQIRFPRGSKTKMMIAVSDVDGTLLAIYRMPDATIFSIDVATAKARNVAYFSSPTANVLTDLPGVPLETAISNRTLSFGGQPLYPPGIEKTNEGPFFRSLYVRDSLTPCMQGSQAVNPNQSGIVFFPGSLPVYKGGQLVGGLGVSGDGVEQDDYVTAGGARGFEPPEALRADQVFVRGVRLGYLKFPRNPEE